MSKDFFKCLLSIIYFISGILITILFAYYLDVTSPAYILTIILGIFLLITGFVSFILHYKNHIIIENIKQDKSSFLAKWSYQPLDYTLIKNKLLEDYYTDLSIVVLIGILGLVVAFGFIFSTNPEHFIISYMIITFTVLLSSFLSVCLSLYHNTKLEKCTTTIITNQYIYYNGELYSLYKSCYMLDEVEIIYEEHNYLKFNYGIPGTPYSSYQELIIPIPEKELHLAQKIKNHYLALIP